MRSINGSLAVQGFQILSDRDLGCPELLREVLYQNATVAIDDVQDGSPPFFI
jgi:hypothetical protein